MSERFTLAHNDRDAWASIRGYVYQVDRTLVSWLDLKADEAIELECGEDIDLLAPALLREDTDFERTFEQVKCLDQNVTLRSAVTREALCSFTDHIEANPSVLLRFRFLTNALPGEERPGDPLLSVPGILLWEEIRRGTMSAEKSRTATESIAAFLRTLDAPREALSASWQNTVALTHSISRFDSFVSRFEWSTAATDSDSMAYEVEQLLIRIGYVENQADAKVQHDKLFVYVLRKLAQRKTDAPRRLDLKSLKNTLASGLITDFEREILGQMKSWRGAMEEGFARLHAGMGEVKQLIVANTQEGLRDQRSPEPLRPAQTNSSRPRHTDRQLFVEICSLVESVLGPLKLRPWLNNLETQILDNLIAGVFLLQKRPEKRFLDCDLEAQREQLGMHASEFLTAVDVNMFPKDTPGRYGLCRDWKGRNEEAGYDDYDRAVDAVEHPFLALVKFYGLFVHQCRIKLEE